MKKILLIAILIFSFSQFKVQAQNNNGMSDFPAYLTTIIEADDSVALDKIITKENVNECYGNYSILSQAIRADAKKCFDLLIAKGADVNKICNGYVPPLMHAAKYGKLEMVKILIAKGANKNYVYDGDDPNIADMTPLSYAEHFKQTEVAAYLKSLK